jgi:alpha-tubulin suppressor-like RCC1 family protein
MGFSYAGKCLDEVYITDSEIIDRFVGTQLWGWGDNTVGQLGTNSTTHRSSPVQTISGGNNWKQVAAGYCHTAAIKTDGTLWLWGSSFNGQLGNNSIQDQSSPVQTISGGANWKQVAAGYCHTAAIKTDGTLWLWGFGTSGQLGNNAITNRSSPVQTVSGGTNWKQVSTGDSNTAAIKTDGSLWLWGSGTNGILGNNDDIINHSSPIQTISGGNNWKQVSAGCGNTAAIKTDGSLWLWGVGVFGQLGNNARTNHSSPVQTVSGGNNWEQVDTDSQHTAAIKTDGTLWLWGDGSGGALGHNAITDRSSPVQTISGGTNWKQVSVGNFHTAAIKTDGSLWLWGNGTNGEMGNNSTQDQSSPVQTISGGNNWKQVSAVFRTNMALRYQE